MKKIEELRNYLLENYVDEDGDLVLNSLDFSDFDGNVYIDGMKVKGDLYQNGHEVQGNLYQSNNEAQGNLHNKNNKYGGDLYENTSTKLLKEVTAEELAELGYTFKGAQ